ncbi:MAG: hypothetical protein IT384_25730 [Deltaproteobacteria bacterium]|nr:hypothetical protein [Deltaproteobacteria bacterium]
MRPVGLWLLVAGAGTLGFIEQAGAQTCATAPELCNLTVHSTTEQADLGVAIDVVLVGDGFTDAASFNSLASSAISQFRSATTGIYTRVPGLFNFHVVEVISATTDVADADLTDTALGMDVSGPFIRAHGGRANLAALNAPDVDVVVALANAGSGRANANYNTQLASGGMVRLSQNVGVLTHELGHALIHLADEYVEAGLCAGTPSESLMLAEANVTTDASCYKFQEASGAQCLAGARYCASGAYRSASGCFMRSNNGAACPACDHEIDEVLAQRRTQRDLAPPWVITFPIGSGGPVAGVLTFSAQAHDDFFTPIDFAFEIDGVFVGRVDASPGGASLSFDTSTLPDGAHALIAIASDASGHAHASLARTFTTANTTDTTPPTVAITTPVANEQLSGTSGVVVQAGGGDIAELRLSIDGLPVSVEMGSPSLYYSWDVRALAPGLHRLDAIAIDYSGNAATAAPIQVRTSTGAAPSSIYVVVHEPIDGSAIGAYFRLSWSAQGGGGETGGGPNGGGAVASALILDGVLVSPNPLGGVTGRGYDSTIIDARTWSNGPHQLRVRGALGSVTQDSDPIIVVKMVPTIPSVFVRSPSANAALRGVVPIDVVAIDDAPINRITVRFDGVAIGVVTGGAGNVSFDTRARPMGCGRIDAEALSTDGGRAVSAEVSVCIDNVAPGVSIGRPLDGALIPVGALGVRVDLQETGSSVERVTLSVDGTAAAETWRTAGTSAALLINLGAGAHVLRATATDGAGNSGTSAPITVTAGTCSAAACDDRRACTTDRCASSGACVHAWTAGCCGTATDCDDGDACTQDSCGGTTCAHAPIAGCCNHDLDCDDGSACTEDHCSGPGGTCAHASAGCCATPADCGDGDACTVDLCVGGFCAHDRAPGCCTIAADCDDSDPCTTDRCQGSACSHSAVAGCCRNGADCSDANNCTLDTCNAQHQCQSSAIPNCCATDADCTTLNPCRATRCGLRGQCELTEVPGCCVIDVECDDQDECTEDRCAQNVCAHPASGACCTIDADCDDGDPCTAEACNARQRCEVTARLCDAGIASDGGVPAEDAAASDGSPLDAAAEDGSPGNDVQPSADASTLDGTAAPVDASSDGDASVGGADAAAGATPRADAELLADRVTGGPSMTGGLSGGGCACRSTRGREGSSGSIWIGLVLLAALRRPRSSPGSSARAE